MIASFASVCWRCQGNIYALRDLPVYNPVKSRLPALGAEIDASTPALELVASRAANSGAAEPALTQGELCSVVEALAQALSLTAESRVAVTCAGGSGASLALQLATVRSGGAVIINEKREMLVDVLKEQGATTLVADAESLATLGAASAADKEKALASVQQVVVVGDSAAQAQELEQAGKKVFTIGAV